MKNDDYTFFRNFVFARFIVEGNPTEVRISVARLAAGTAYRDFVFVHNCDSLVGEKPGLQYEFDRQSLSVVVSNTLTQSLADGDRITVAGRLIS